MQLNNMEPTKNVYFNWNQRVTYHIIFFTLMDKGRISNLIEPMLGREKMYKYVEFL